MEISDLCNLRAVTRESTRNPSKPAQPARDRVRVMVQRAAGIPVQIPSCATHSLRILCIPPEGVAFYILRHSNNNDF